MTTVTDWDMLVSGYGYDNANRLTGIALPKGVNSAYRYDAARADDRHAHQHSNGHTDRHQHAGTDASRDLAV